MITAADYSDWTYLAGLYLRNLSHADRYRTFERELSSAGLTVKIVHDFLMSNAEGLVSYHDLASGKDVATFTHVFNVYGFYEAVSAGRFSPDQSRALTWAGPKFQASPASAALTGPYPPSAAPSSR